MVDQWSQARVFEVCRRQPIESRRGKVSPFQTLGAAEPRPDP